MMTLAPLTALTAVVATFNMPGPATEGQVCESGSDYVFCRDNQELYVQENLRYVVAVDVNAQKVRWTTDTGAAAIASCCAVTRNVVALGWGPGEIRALSRTAGLQLWTADIRSSQVVGTDEYVVAQTSEREGVIALDPSDGREVWRHAATARTNPGFVRILDSSTALLLTSRFGIDATTGKVQVRWGNATVNATAAARSGELQIVARDARVDAYRPDSSLAWRAELPVEGFGNDRALHMRSVPSGVVAVIAGRFATRLIRITLMTNTGAVAWRRDLTLADPAMLGPTSIAGETVLVSSNSAAGNQCSISALDAKTGKLKWENQFPIALRSDRGFSPDERRNYVLTLKGGMTTLMAIDVETGRVESEFVLGRR